MNIDKKVESILTVFEEKNRTLTLKIEENQQSLIDELNKLKEQVNKKKGLIF